MQEVEEPAEEEDEELGFAGEGEPCYRRWFGSEGGPVGGIFFIDAVGEVLGIGEGSGVGE